MAILHNKLWQAVHTWGCMREVLFLPGRADDFPETAAQGQHPVGKEGNGTPGRGATTEMGLMCLGQHHSAVSRPENSKVQQWFRIFCSYEICLTYGWQIWAVMLWGMCSK